ncbi:MAG: prepilin-type N-terminal cleavage/methylation domain-containing protein [Candidatus Acidiferrales bacterium]
MTQTKIMCHHRQQLSMQKLTSSGFTLVELMIAMVVFVVVAGAAFSLFNKQVQLITHQQNLSAVNIGLRNAMAQVEMDLSGAGQNLLKNVPNAPSISLGVIIQNDSPGTAGVPACAVNTATWAYPVPSACFDSVEIMGGPKSCNGCAATSPFYPTVPVLQIVGVADAIPTNPADPVTTSAVAPIYLIDANPSDTVSLATIASNFRTGDELLVLNPSNTPLTTIPPTQPHCPSNPSAAFASQSSFCMTAVTLTSNASALVAGCPNSLASCIKLNSYNTTSVNGTPGALDDPLGIFIDALAPNGYNYYNSISPGPYGGGGNPNAYVIDLGAPGAGSASVWYAVQTNPANANDTQLMRCLGAPCAAGGGQPLTDQVIGFKVGAAVWNEDPSVAQTDLSSYFYNAALFCNGAIWTSNNPVTFTSCTTTPPPNNDPYDFSLIQSARVSVVARTTPNMDPALPTFKNGFDNGPYLVQQASVVVDLRNMSNPNLGN